jgi:hypothetical protein
MFGSRSKKKIVNKSSSQLTILYDRPTYLFTLFYASMPDIDHATMKSASTVRSSFLVRFQIRGNYLKLNYVFLLIRNVLYIIMMAFLLITMSAVREGVFYCGFYDCLET